MLYLSFEYSWNVALRKGNVQVLVLHRIRICNKSDRCKYKVIIKSKIYIADFLLSEHWENISEHFHIFQILYLLLITKNIYLLAILLRKLCASFSLSLACNIAIFNLILYSYPLNADPNDFIIFNVFEFLKHYLLINYTSELDVMHWSV